MKLNELESIVLKAASSLMKKEGEDAFNRGLVTYFKGKKIDNIYHIYGRVKDESKLNEFNTHIKINLQKKKLEGVECACDDFKEFASSGYTLMCSHIIATAYKFFSLLPKQNNEQDKAESNEEVKKNSAVKLIRRKEKDCVFYEVQTALRSKNIILQQNELRAFLKSIEIRKVKFNFDYIEYTVPILHKDMPIVFNLKEDGEFIVLTTQRRLPISLNTNNDVYFFKNELYLPSKNQIEKFTILYEKLASHGKIVYRKNLNNYNNLIGLLSGISKNINISESLKNFAYDLLKPELCIFQENHKIYCCVFISYGGRRINILDKDKNLDISLRDYKKEERFLMEMEKNRFIKVKDRFMFIGGDDELFNILTGRRSSIHDLGKVILGSGLKDIKIYNSSNINAAMHEMDGYYDFACSIGDIERRELKSAFEAYDAKNRFYKTRNNDFLDFEDDNVRSLFKLFEILNLNGDLAYETSRLETSKALYLYENIKHNGLGFIKGSEKLEEIEDKLVNINNKNITLPEGFNGTLREYQVKGFKWLKILSELHFGGILADEMGLGKTIQVIAFLLSEQNKKTIIICPTSLIYNWKDELQKFAPSLKVLIVHGTFRSEKADRINEYDVILTTYGILRIDIDRYSNITFDFCIIDEAQNIKNAEAQNTKAIKAVNAGVKFALTGTPIENNLTELWSIFDFIMPGYLYSKEKFEDKFILRGDENLETLKLLIQPFILRRTKKEVIQELPDKIERKFLVEMTADQKAVYSNYIKAVRAVIKNNTDGRIEIFSYLTKLRQICLDPSLIIEDYAGGSGKLEMVMELIKEHIDSDRKILLFSQFTTVLGKIGKNLDKEKIKFLNLNGKTKPKERAEMVKEFNSNADVKVFLISLKAGGTGLNLTAANLVIHFDPWWNPAVQDQATDRAHRIGQKQVVEVIKLVSKGTIEEKIILLQEGKKELINNILTDKLQNSSLLNRMSREELYQLFERD